MILKELFSSRKVKVNGLVSVSCSRPLQQDRWLSTSVLLIVRYVHVNSEKTSRQTPNISPDSTTCM